MSLEKRTHNIDVHSVFYINHVFFLPRLERQYTSLGNSDFSHSYRCWQVMDTLSKSPMGVGPWRLLRLPIYNTSGVSEGDWFPIIKAHTIMYRVRIARFSQDDHRAPPCLKVSLNHCTKGSNFQWMEKRYTLPN